MTTDELLWHARHVCRELMPTDHPSGVRSIDLAPGYLTLTDLDRVLGERGDMPRMPYADAVWWYELREDGTPYVCTVFAASRDGDRLSRITLRQDPGRA